MDNYELFWGNINCINNYREKPYVKNFHPTIFLTYSNEVPNKTVKYTKDPLSPYCYTNCSRNGILLQISTNQHVV